MPIDLIDTTTNQFHVLDSPITIADILNALAFLQREKDRKRKYKKVYHPTGKPRGRPKKTPAPDQKMEA